MAPSPPGTVRPKRNADGHGPNAAEKARRRRPVNVRSPRAQEPETGVDAVELALSAPRIVIDRVSPCVDGGLFPAKAVVGQWLDIEADIFIDGHDVLHAELIWKNPQGEMLRQPLEHQGNDRWQTFFMPQTRGLCGYSIEAWANRWATVRRDLGKLRTAGVVLRRDIDEAIALVLSTLSAATQNLEPPEVLEHLRDLDDETALDLLLGGATAEWMASADPRPFVVRYTPEVRVDVERTAAGFASWYELFPRSQSTGGEHGTFDDVIPRLPAIAAMGFDVLYLPPIHPIGMTARKGRNNSLKAGPDDPGSPYAIGSVEGGHEAIHPQLGGIESFRRLRDAAAAHGMELALDFAIQCSPDHPWLREHPDWFDWRADGSLRCAENPPKKYEDIVNVAFYAQPPQPQLWLALRDVVEYWIGEGVKIFRVDNPHTKPLPFWEWLIADIRSRHPDTIFLAEAFTRPAMMYRLAKIGFAQSYTYFTWRDDKEELTEYLTELTEEAPRDFFRPHFFVNTPDINPPFLQESGRPGFLIRAALATTLSGLWGMYSGFELCESAPLPGREEYLDSEKYQLRPRDWTAPGNIIGEIAKLNAIRRDNAAFHSHLGLKFYTADNEQVLFYGKRSQAQDVTLFVAVSLDPHQAQATHFYLPLKELDADEDDVLAVEELMSGQRFTWRGSRQHWYFNPAEMPFAIWRVQKILN
ncbi:MAG: alpha-1,4-glucan--maltose-1-phosphate maltosyltransferase [Panacagrimonas sp.]